MTIYFDAFLNGLIPVRDCTNDEQHVTGIVSRTKNGYKAGERIKGFPHNFVVKTRRTKYHQYVKTANI